MECDFVEIPTNLIDKELISVELESLITIHDPQCIQIDPNETNLALNYLINNEQYVDDVNFNEENVVIYGTDNDGFSEQYQVYLCDDELGGLANDDEQTTKEIQYEQVLMPSDGNEYLNEEQLDLQDENFVCDENEIEFQASDGLDDNVYLMNYENEKEELDRNEYIENIEYLATNYENADCDVEHQIDDQHLIVKEEAEEEEEEEDEEHCSDEFIVGDIYNNVPLASDNATNRPPNAPSIIYEKRFYRGKLATEIRQFYDYISNTKIVEAPKRQVRAPRKQQIKPLKRSGDEIILKQIVVASNGYVETRENGILKERRLLKPTETISISDESENDCSDKENNAFGVFACDSD